MSVDLTGFEPVDVKMPSDSLKKDAIKGLSGEVVTYSLRDRLTWDQFRDLPEDLKKEYLEGLIKRYNVTQTRLAKMFCVSTQSIYQCYKRFGLKPAAGAFKEAEWIEFCTGKYPEPVAKEKKPEPKKHESTEALLTEDEAYAVAEFIDLGLLEDIRKDTDIDSMQWLINMVHAYEKLKVYGKYKGVTG